MENSVKKAWVRAAWAVLFAACAAGAAVSAAMARRAIGAADEAASRAAALQAENGSLLDAMDKLSAGLRDASAKLRFYCDADCEFAYQLPEAHAFFFESEGSEIYGSAYVPGASWKGPRPCIVALHGFPGFARWDDVARSLCRAGFTVIVPHHRGAWGSRGRYTVSGCVRDAVNIAAAATSGALPREYRIDPSAVWLFGHSMGGNSALGAAAQVKAVKGAILAAPCDIGGMALSKDWDRPHLKRFLEENGASALACDGLDALCDDIIANAKAMSFAANIPALAGRRVYLAGGFFDSTIGKDAIEEADRRLSAAGVEHETKIYRSEHSFSGVRVALTADIARFAGAADARFPK